jgi:hypothetical protein
VPVQGGQLYRVQGGALAAGGEAFAKGAVPGWKVKMPRCGF